MTNISSAARGRSRDERLPALFATETQLFGWQGMSASIPANWSLTSFAGASTKGTLRIDDEEIPRMELRWEGSGAEVDLDKSVEKFLDTIQRDAHKKKEHFEIVGQQRAAAQLVRRKGKVVSFGWRGERDAAVGQGCGVVWKCEQCGRVVVAHIMGRGVENHDALSRLADEIFATMDCHGQGGWSTWSLFGLRVEIPEEFSLGTSKLMAGRLELEWLRTHKRGPLGLITVAESLRLIRISLADVLLEHDSLESYASDNLSRLGRKWIFGKLKPGDVRGHAALRGEGKLRDPGLRLRRALLDIVTRRRAERAHLVVWHCDIENKIFALLTDLSAANRHVTSDVLDSVACHA